MMSDNPARLLQVIKERHVLVNNLKAALVLAKGDNVGDAFKLNRLIRYQQEQIQVLEGKLKEILKQHEQMKHIKDAALKQDEQQKVLRLRKEARYWTFQEDV
jgi:NAD(P)H-hydrate repair Nnr-like enzyme with NAD(P)H-hydrate epimerase domain